MDTSLLFGSEKISRILLRLAPPVMLAHGDMKTPMAVQIIGAVTNIILDPLFIFGLFGLPEMGIAGTAADTAASQIAAALVVMKKGFRKPSAFRVNHLLISEPPRFGQR